jgi:hypothetical protein
MQSELLHMMVDRLLLGISARNGLWDEWRGFFGAFHPSTRDDPPSKDDAFKPSSSQISSIQLNESFVR